ncbi:cobalamin-binding protein [Nitrospina gracilis]|uniref:cobalamin-binding protein n=1 Tax=Nitrospina gracilis TaxID=35801 RepID=UPI001F3CEB87|nr:cobalamin-binding protein [Nitrospina gracilis]MCF8721655.1 iron complex transport system substrate-binding protein [Nitrospina gracilis Nb-211]
MNVDLHRTPRRIICLTEETTETLYCIGEQDRIVGISGYTVRPSQARKEKPKVSAFLNARIDKILDLKPDLVLGFSNLQADIVTQLVRAGIPVHVFNQRTVAGIFDMVRMLGAMIGEAAKAETLMVELKNGLDAIEQSAAQLPRRPRVYFEEWNDPLISGIGWVSELISIAGGEDCFPELAACSFASQRTIHDPEEVIRRAPDIIIGSWCGKRFRPEKLKERPGWDAIPAVQREHVYEIKSANILQPGPAALTDGVAQIHRLIQNWADKTA